MNVTKVYSGKKRYSSECATVIGPQYKRRKSAKKPQSTEVTADQSLLTESEPMTITDLNDQCLEIIFKRLTAQDMLNVAAANKWLNASAGPVFRQIYGQKLIQLTSIAIRNSQICVADQMVLVSGLQNCLQFLRCFGPYTSKLSIQFGDSSKNCAKYVNQYVNKYCNKTLVHITFHSAAESFKQYLQKPYANVKSIYMTKSRLVKHLSQFDSWFPNVQRLELVFNAFDPKFADVHFPNLQELRLFLISQYRFRGNLLKYMTHLLQKNPHIKCLEIDIEAQPATKDLLNIENFLASIKMNSAITALRTTYGFGFHTIHSSDLFELARTLPLLMEIDLKPYRFSVEEVICFICQQKLLRYFRFTIDKPSKFNYLRTRLDYEWQSSMFMDKWQSTIVTLKR